MIEEQVLMGRLRDLAKELSFIPYELFGGHEMAERKVVGFGSEELFGYPGQFPVTILKVTPALEKFGEDPLNSRVTTENAVNLKPGDVFSVRGKGKFILESIGGTTKRGRTYVNVKRYQ